MLMSVYPPSFQTTDIVNNRKLNFKYVTGEKSTVYMNITWSKNTQENAARLQSQCEKNISLLLLHEIRFLRMEILWVRLIGFTRVTGDGNLW